MEMPGLKLSALQRDKLKRCNQRESQALHVHVGPFVIPGSRLKGKWKWHGAVLAPNNNCIYGIPQSAEDVLKINPDTGEVSTIGGPFPGTQKWYVV